VLDYSSEVEHLRPLLGDAAADDLVARERREIFSVYPEVRFAAWGGALLLAAAAGVFIKNNFERFEPLHIAVVLAILAAACYAWVWRREQSHDRGLVGEFVLLLGALLVSADVGFIEQQFDVFGESGVRHLLLLAIFHAFTAYRFDSKLVLSVSLTSLAAWMGLDRNFGGDAKDYAIRAFACAAAVVVWRVANRRRGFDRVFEHFAATLALTGGVLLLDGQPLVALIVTLVIAAAVTWWGFRTRVEAFVLYAFVAAVIAVAGFAISVTTADELVILITILLAIPALVFIHRAFRRDEP